MPRGRRKLGAWDCTIWFAGGLRYRLQSTNDGHTDAEIAEALRSHLLPILEASERAEAKRVAAQSGTGDGSSR